MADETRKPELVAPPERSAPKPRALSPAMHALRALCERVSALARAENAHNPTATTAGLWRALADECDLILVVTDPSPPAAVAGDQEQLEPRNTPSSSSP